MPDPVPPTVSAAPVAPEPPRPRWVVPLLGGLVVVLAAAGLGYLVGAEYFERDARDPLEAVADMQPAGLTCTQLVRVDDAGSERAAVCLSTGNEVLTIGTFSTQPDADAWASELCEASLYAIVPTQGALVVFDNALVTVVAGPLFSESGGRVPDPNTLAENIATSLDGEWQPYEC